MRKNRLNDFFKISAGGIFIVFLIVVVVFSMFSNDRTEKSIINHEKYDKELLSSITKVDTLDIEFEKYRRISTNNSKKYYIIFNGEDTIKKDKKTYWVRITASQKRAGNFKEEKEMVVYKKKRLTGSSYYVYFKNNEKDSEKVHYLKIKK